MVDNYLVLLLCTLFLLGTPAHKNVLGAPVIILLKVSQHSSIIWSVWLNGWVFVYELSGCGFESHLFKCFMIGGKIPPIVYKMLGLYCLKKIYLFCSTFYREEASNYKIFMMSLICCRCCGCLSVAWSLLCRHSTGILATIFAML